MAGSVDQNARLATINAEIASYTIALTCYQNMLDAGMYNCIGGCSTAVTMRNSIATVLEALQAEKQALTGEVTG